jgi:hypothetical protein
MRSLVLQICALTALGAFTADNNLINLVIAGAGVVGAIMAFQKWVDGRVNHRIDGLKTLILLEMDLLRLEIGLKTRHQHLAEKKKEEV